MRFKVVSISTSLFIFISTTLALLISQPTSANAACVPAAYPPVICLNSSSGITPAAVDTSVAAAVALFESAPPPPVGTPAQAVITVPVTITDPVTKLQSVVNVTQTITKVVSSSGAVTISRTLTVGNTTMVLTGGSGTAVSVSIPANSDVTAQGSGFLAGSFVDIYIYSKSIYLGSFKVDSNGDVVDQIKIPANLPPGNHSLVIAGKSTEGKQFILPTPIIVGKAVVNSAKTLKASVFFSSKQAVVTPSQRLKINSLKKMIPKSAKNVKVVIRGYTEKAGKNTKSAKSISRIRANAVARYLKSGGLKKALFNVKGLGLYGLKGKLGNRVEIQITWK